MPFHGKALATFHKWSPFFFMAGNMELPGSSVFHACPVPDMEKPSPSGHSLRGQGSSMQFRKKSPTSFSDKYNASRFASPVSSLTFSLTAWFLDMLM